MNVGKNYLMTIDLQPEAEFEWEVGEEEYPVYCSVGSDVFSCRAIGEPIILLHRFGGSYGQVRFLLTVSEDSEDQEETNIKILLLNK